MRISLCNFGIELVLITIQNYYPVNSIYIKIHINIYMYINTYIYICLYTVKVKKVISTKPPHKYLDLHFTSRDSIATLSIAV